MPRWKFPSKKKTFKLSRTELTEHAQFQSTERTKKL